MKHKRTAHKLLSALLAFVMLLAIAAQGAGYVYADEVRGTEETEAVQQQEQDEENSPVQEPEEDTPAPAEEPEETPAPTQEPEEETPAPAAEPEEETPAPADELEEDTPAPAQESEEEPPAPTDEPEDDTFVITDWTWVTDNASILEDGTVTLSKDTPTATAGGPRKVKPSTNTGVYTWDNVYAVLPEQIVAQDSDGNETFIDLVKENGKVVWTYSGGKLGEGDCPQAGTYVFTAQVDSAEGTLAKDAAKLEITVIFVTIANLDNGFGTDNGLPNYGVRIIIDAPESADSYVVDAYMRFLMSASTENGGRLAVERYRYDKNAGEYRMYANNISSYGYSNEQAYEYGLDSSVNLLLDHNTSYCWYYAPTPVSQI